MICSNFSSATADLTLVFIPELKGRSPEEINLLFDEGIGALQSRYWKPEDLRGDLEMKAGGVQTKQVENPDVKVVEQERIA